MSSARSHFIIGAALALPAVDSPELASVLRPWQIPVSAGLLATLPDLDLTGRRAFGVPYNSLLAHRGLFHSPLFLMLLAAALSGIITRGHSRTTFAWLWLVWAGCMVSHPLLDALTDGGRRVMLLLPSREHGCSSRGVRFTPRRAASKAYFAELASSAAPKAPFCLAFLAIGIVGLLARQRHSASMSSSRGDSAESPNSFPV